MAACTECGNYLDEDEDICPNCGYEPRSLESKIRDDDFGEYDSEADGLNLGKTEKDDLEDKKESDDEDLAEII